RLWTGRALSRATGARGRAFRWLLLVRARQRLPQHLQAAVLGFLLGLVLGRLGATRQELRHERLEELAGVRPGPSQQRECSAVGRRKRVWLLVHVQVAPRDIRAQVEGAALPPTPPALRWCLAGRSGRVPRHARRGKWGRR